MTDDTAQTAAEAATVWCSRNFYLGNLARAVGSLTALILEREAAARAAAEAERDALRAAGEALAMGVVRQDAATMRRAYDDWRALVDGGGKP